MPALEDSVYSDDDEDIGAEADMNILDAFMPVSPIPTTRIHKDHPVEQIIRDLNLAPQTRRMTKNLEEHVCACARYQVNLKVSHLLAVKRIFRYLKGQPKLGLWYPKDYPFDLVAYTDSDYTGASLDRKSTTGGCQFLRCRLISWQCKKQTVVANSITEAEYVAASSCYGQVLWIQNQLLDYGYNFMHTKIFIDNNRKAKKSVRLMMGKLFGMELKSILFWSTIMAKTINGEEQLHALVDEKKIIITKSSVRRDLQLVDEEGEGSTIPTDPHHTPTFIQPSTQPQKTQQPRKPKRKDTQVPQPSDPIENVADEAVHKELGDSLVRAATTASSLEVEQDSGGGPWCQETMGDTIAQTRLKLDELMALCTTLQNWVLDLEKTKTTQHNEIASLKRRVKKLKKKDRIDAIDANEEITLVSVHDVKVSAGEEVFTTTVDDITLDQDKGKGILIESMKPMNKKDQIRLDEETAYNLQAKFDEEEGLTREKAKKE
ncbi:hypothetical protein Tco_1538885 [Tanacetum coccineum]